MTSALKACLRRNVDETGLLKDNMDDGNSKKILSVSQVNIYFYKFSSVFNKNKLVAMSKIALRDPMNKIKHNDIVAVSASLCHFIYCLPETLDDNDMLPWIHIIKINELSSGSRFLAELQLLLVEGQPQITHRVRSNYFSFYMR